MKTIELREIQQLTFERCKDEKRFGIFFDMGVGKTATMLELIDYLVFEKLEVSKVLIIAPPTVINKAKVWQKEIEKWSNYKFFDFIQYSGTPEERIDKIESNKNTIALLNDTLIDWYKKTFINLNDFDMIIIDESSRFKNHKAKKFTSLSKMINKRHRVYLLSGTPMPNGYQDLWSQMYLLDDGKRLESNYYRFIKKYGYYVNDYRFVFLKETKKVLDEKVKDICIFADSDDLKLPEKEEHIVMLNWGEEKQQAYNHFEKNYILKLDDGDISVFSITSFMNKTLQLANGSIYIDKDLNYKLFDETKFNWLVDFSKTMRSNALVFYSFKFDKKKLLTIKGARAIENDNDVDDWNEGKIKLGIISPYSFQYGANLQFGGSIIVWYGLLWGLENFLQSNKRIWRSGQKEKVDIYYLLMENTFDLDVYKRLVSKEETQQEFLDKIKLKHDKMKGEKE